MLSPVRFLAISFAAALAVFAAAWIWIAAVPLAFMDPEYPYWLAKQRLLAACDLGDLLIVGDSRAAVDIIPAHLDTRATNLAIGGGQAVEAFVTVARAMQCPVLPKRVIVSIDLTHFVQPDLFWERSVRYGLVGGGPLREVLNNAARLGDASVLAPHHNDHLPPLLRAWLAGIRFPPLYFNALLKGGVLLRWQRNQAALAEGIASRGQYFFGRGAGSVAPASEMRLNRFVPLPVQNDYFDRMLALLQSRGIPVLFVAMPINAATKAAVKPGIERDFAAYLDAFAARYPGFQVTGQLLTVWPDRFFGDDFGHLNPLGAARFSAGFSRLLQETRAQSPATAGERISAR
jgi:hypothetical protein